MLQGMAFPDISSLNALNPFFNMVQQNLLDAPMFSIYLNPNSSAENAGTLIFGGSDSSLYSGSLKSYAVLDPSYAPLRKHFSTLLMSPLHPRLHPPHCKLSDFVPAHMSVASLQ